jgi:hypothetical protein
MFGQRFGISSCSRTITRCRDLVEVSIEESDREEKYGTIEVAITGLGL